MSEKAALRDISVVIPVYNEAQRLPETLASVCDSLPATGGWEVIVVDDGSRDDSAAIAERFAATESGVRLLRMDANRGKGHAVRHGVMASQGKRVLYCDADLATPIDELDRLHRALDNGFSAAIGSRAVDSAQIETRQPRAREWLGRIANRFIQTTAVPGIRDTQCGFKLFDGEKARRVFSATGIDGWGFDVEVLYLFHRREWTVAEVPVRWAHQRGSKVRARDYPAALADIVRIRLRHRTGREGSR